MITSCCLSSATARFRRGVVGAGWGCPRSDACRHHGGTLRAHLDQDHPRPRRRRRRAADHRRRPGSYRRHGGRHDAASAHLTLGQRRYMSQDGYIRLTARGPIVGPTVASGPRALLFVDIEPEELDANNFLGLRNATYDAVRGARWIIARAPGPAADERDSEPTARLLRAAGCTGSSASDPRRRPASCISRSANRRRSRGTSRPTRRSSNALAPWNSRRWWPGQARYGSPPTTTTACRRESTSRRSCESRARYANHATPK